MRKIIIVLGLLITATSHAEVVKRMCHGVLSYVEGDRIVKVERNDKVDPIIVYDYGDSFTAFVGKDEVKHESGRLTKTTQMVSINKDNPSFRYVRVVGNDGYGMYSLSIPLVDKSVSTRDCRNLN